jgi:hypothetical protein
MLTVNQSANGQAAFVSFGHSRHTGKFPQKTRASNAYRELPGKIAEKRHVQSGRVGQVPHA